MQGHYSLLWLEKSDLNTTQREHLRQSCAYTILHLSTLFANPQAVRCLGDTFTHSPAMLHYCLDCTLIEHRAARKTMPNTLLYTSIGKQERRPNEKYLKKKLVLGPGVWWKKGVEFFDGSHEPRNKLQRLDPTFARLRSTFITTS